MNLDPLINDLSDSLALIQHLASITNEITTDLPTGYHAPRPADGIRRPVEDIIIANETRGVTHALERARTELTNAVVHAQCSAQLLDRAIKRWEGETKS